MRMNTKVWWLLLVALLVICVDAKLSPIGIEMEYYTTTTTGGWTVTTKEQLNSCGYVISSPNAAGYYNTYSFNASYAQYNSFVSCILFSAGTYTVFGRVQGHAYSCNSNGKRQPGGGGGGGGGTSTCWSDGCTLTFDVRNESF